MIAKHISFKLPIPWKGEAFKVEQVGAVNFLVGPNGSGKSKFAVALRTALGPTRILGTDRLSGMEQFSAIRNIYGDHFQNGLAKNQFSNFKSQGQQGSGIDTVILLEERLDLRIQVEATLSHLFDRKIILDWDSGNLVARALLRGTQDSYRLDRDECHGIKELLVLLTHLYNTEQPFLIIDEPELNLHPQYQSFFMQEVRKVAGDPTLDPSKKIVFLVTHSPFILDFRSIDDVRSVFSFDLSRSIPRQMLDVNEPTATRLRSLVPRLNVQHKQLFFSDNPVFVEGVFDAQIVETIQEARGVSMSGAGSCVIDAGGVEDANKYFELCAAFGKAAHFLYDLDSLFRGSLRSCLKADGTIQGFLAGAGLGADFGKYCGELDAKLTGLIDSVLQAATPPAGLATLKAYYDKLPVRKDWATADWGRARVAMLTAISIHRAGVVAATSTNAVAEVEGRLLKIVEALKERRINLLPGGTLERYLPSYTGDPYNVDDSAKRAAVSAEVDAIAAGMTAAALSARYGDLFACISALPSKLSVDPERVLREYLSRYIHELQNAVVGNTEWQLPDISARLRALLPATLKVFVLRELARDGQAKFKATIEVAAMLGRPPRKVRVDERTNAGMGEFVLENY